jgi:hypothetical protein
MTDCTICCEPYKGHNKKVVCIHCQFACCRSCIKTYVFESVNDAKCMNCSKEWNREFLIDSFSYTFVNKDYKKHRENILFDRQKSMMEETQAIVLQRQEYKKYDAMIKKIHEEIHELYAKIRQYQTESWNMRNNTITTVNVAKVKFFGHCPKSDCKGFITSSWRCGVCEQRVCKSCKEEIGDGNDALKLHACNPDTLATLKQIKQDCRNCPKCKAAINKISGCHQMFCTNCQISFCWRTGEIFHKNIHNPHYFEWMRRTGGVVTTEGPCSGDIQLPYDTNTLVSKITDKHSSEILELIRFVRHIKYNEMPPLNNGTVNDDNLEYRIKYLMGDDSEEKFKIKLQRKDKKNERQREVYQILDMFVNTVEQTIRTQLLLNRQEISSFERRYYRYRRRNNTFNYDPIKPAAAEKFVNVIGELVKYTNDSLLAIKMRYKNKIPYINRIENTNSTSINYEMTSSPH